MRVKDWIQWQPASQGFWSPVNLFEVHPKGIEWSGKLLYRQQKTSISLNSTYSYTKSTIENTKTNTEGISGNQLMYVPLHNGNIAGHLNFRGFFINSNVSYTGYRYTTNSNSDWLEAFTLTNIMVGKILRFNKLELTGSAKISNLFNTVYQNLAYRAMPGRNYSIGLKVNFHTPLTN
jgi:iron complex outermembrane receptor protein